MKKHEFKATINAPKEKVWKTLWNEQTYREWTSVFAEGSTVKTDWKKGSKVLFLDGKGDGMVSTVAENKPNEYMSIKHLGYVIDGKEDTTSEAVQKWAGAMENYTLKSVNGNTEIVVDMDITEDHEKYFVETWPKALKKLKEIAEQN